MEVAFSPAFLRDLKRVSDVALTQAVKQAIAALGRAHGLQDIPGLRRMHTDERYYRLRVGDYRLGILLNGQTLILIRFMHRRDIHRYFP